MPKEVIDTFHSSPFTTYAVPETPPPPPEEAAPGTDSKIQPKARSQPTTVRSEEHTSELQSLMRTSYAVFCLKKKTATTTAKNQTHSNASPIMQTLHKGIYAK